VKYKRERILKKSILVSMVLAASVLSSPPSFATSLAYNLNFNALLGPSGTGSFQYDDEAMLLTNLKWDFGSGIVGGFSFIPTPISPGGTPSGLLAEILTQTNFSPISNCIVLVTPTTCRSTRSGGIGLTPGSVNGIVFEVGPSFGSSVYYSFATITPGPFIPGGPPPPLEIGPSTANGYVTATLAVAEPSSMALLLAGLLGFAIATYKRLGRRHQWRR
jgi:hypothetical protein